MKIGLDKKEKPTKQKTKLNKLKAFGKDDITTKETYEKEVQLLEEDIDFFGGIEPELLDQETTESILDGTEKDISTVEEPTEKNEELITSQESEDFEEDFFIDPGVLFSNEDLTKDNAIFDGVVEDTVDAQLEMDDIVGSFVSEEIESMKEDESISVTQEDSIPTISTKHESLRQQVIQEVMPYKSTPNSQDNFMTDYEFEALMEVFSKLTKEEVDALPDNYKKIFYQNFEENEAYLDEDEFQKIRKKLCMSGTIHDKNTLFTEEDNVESFLSQEVKMGKLVLPTNLLNKILNEEPGRVTNSKSFNSIKNKLKQETESLEHVQNSIGCSNDEVEESSIAIYYKDDYVPEAVLLEEGLIGLKAYKVFIQNKIQKCNKNFEIEIKAGSKIKIDTGISYVAAANCNTEIMPGSDTKDLFFEKTSIEDGSVVLTYSALKDTYISRSSIIGCIQI